ncbi:MAG: phage tail terminator family protein [Dialister pneumosintes]
MILKIYEGISSKLYQLTGYPVYFDEVDQNAQYPCFLIRLMDSEQEHVLDRRYERKHSFEIRLFPNEKGEITDINTELYKVAPALYTALEYIQVIEGNKEYLLRGDNMSYKAVDDTLQFLVSYDFFIMKEREKIEFMNTLDIEEGVGDGRKEN